MNGMDNNQKRAQNPRRRKRTRMQNFREAYLPVILAALAIVLIVIIVIGSIRNALQNKEDAKASSIAAAASVEENKKRLDAQAAEILKNGSQLAANYDYDGAIALIDSFEGDIYNGYDDLLALRDRCKQAKKSLVIWNNPYEITNLSLNMLVADSQRAFKHGWMSDMLKEGYLSVSEFSAMLQQLYDNGYVLISMDDIITRTESGYVAGAVYLPEGKTPIMLTQTAVNYYAYLNDGDEDGQPDAKGAGFASRLLVDSNGNLTCEMVNANGETVTGNFDLVPILNAFIAEHPDFSYRGAKATIAVTGYEGVFGYRTMPSVKDSMGVEYYNQQVEGARAVASALRDDGYIIASYTYDHEAYGELTEWDLAADLKLWNDEVMPVIGRVDTLVLAKFSDIGASGKYTGSKFEALKDAGFTHYIGYCDGTKYWAVLAADHVRQGRLIVDGNGIVNNAAAYEGLFDPAAILDPNR